AAALYNSNYNPITGAATGPATNLYFMADLIAGNGDASLSMWLFKSNISKNSDGTFSGSHVDGDLLIEMQFVNGGSTAIPSAKIWSNGSVQPISIDVTNRFAIVNTNQ